MALQTPTPAQKPKDSSPKTSSDKKLRDNPQVQQAEQKTKQFLENAWLTIKRYFPSLDNDTASYYMILVSTYALVSIGLVMVLSSSAVESIRQGNPSYSVFLKQAGWGVLGLILMHVCARTPKDVYKKIAWPCMIFALIGLAAVQLFGYEVNGNKNWISIGPFSGQPSEFAKFALCLWLPMVLALKRKYLSDPQVVAIPVIPVSLAVLFLIFIGHDMGTTLIVLFLIFGAVFVSGVPMRMVTMAGGVLFVLAMLGALLDSNRLARILTWGNSSSCVDDIQGMCWQSQAGLYGLASGGWFGLGLGSSREKWSWLPEAHNDYIFAIVGEELGFFGTMTVLILFCVLGFAFMRIVTRHRDPYIRIATGAVMFWIMGQALVNMGMVMGALPVIGVPLPLISAGGTALLFTLMAIGMVLSFARTEAKEGDDRNTRNYRYRNAAKPVPKKRSNNNKVNAFTPTPQMKKKRAPQLYTQQMQNNIERAQHRDIAYIPDDSRTTQDASQNGIFDQQGPLPRPPRGV